MPAPRRPFGWQPSLCCGSLHKMSNTCTKWKMGETQRKKIRPFNLSSSIKIGLPDSNLSIYFITHASIFHLNFFIVFQFGLFSSRNDRQSVIFNLEKLHSFRVKKSCFDKTINYQPAFFCHIGKKLRDAKHCWPHMCDE